MRRAASYLSRAQLCIFFLFCYPVIALSYPSIKVLRDDICIDYFFTVAFLCYNWFDKVKSFTLLSSASAVLALSV